MLDKSTKASHSVTSSRMKSGTVSRRCCGPTCYPKLLTCPRNFAVYVGMASCRNFDTVNTISKSPAPICAVLG
ncbi:hypothetical protein AYI69_g4056 [Smittium culicis]|uniref:Uncharacterized protein n=1 Tax=Smittium culicis TaxID=133412 RepID=A0A1R1YH22_9FUNG|nr:hypothetical protein AYI69_g4056 [Smittium culicis]